MKRKKRCHYPMKKQSLKKSKKFFICAKKEFSIDRKNHKVRDICHYSGKLRQAAHNNCNLRYRIPKEIPLVFHNGSAYNYHYIIK